MMARTAMFSQKAVFCSILEHFRAILEQIWEKDTLR